MKSVANSIISKMEDDDDPFPTIWFRALPPDGAPAEVYKPDNAKLREAALRGAFGSELALRDVAREATEALERERSACEVVQLHLDQVRAQQSGDGLALEKAVRFVVCA